MNSLKSYYSRLVEIDQEKTAAQNEPQVEIADEAIKQASDYENIGRALAHQVWDELVKEAEIQSTEQAAEAEAVEQNEKVASLKNAILQRMAEDPEYAAHLAAKYLSE